MKIKYSIALVLLLGTVTSSRAQYEEISTDEPSYEYEYEDTTQPYVIPEEATTTTTCGPTTTTTTTCEPTTTTPKPTRTTTPKPTRTTTPKPTTKPPPSWKAGVDEHVGKCKAALKFFVGPTYRTAKTILDAFLCLIPKLESSTESRSQIIRIKSTEILDTISVMTEVGNSPSGILNGFEGVLHFVLQSYRTIVSSMESDIGVSTSDITNAMTDLEVSLYGIIADYKRCHTLRICDDSIDQKPVLKSIQKLTNAVACVSELALKNCENDDANIRDSLYILMLIFDHLVICGHATNVSIAAELNVRCKGISNPWSQCLKVIDSLLGGITEALNAVVNTLLEAVISLVKAIVDLAKCLNDVLKSVFNLVENVTQNLTKTVSSTLKGVTGGLSNILKIGK